MLGASLFLLMHTLPQSRRALFGMTRCSFWSVLGHPQVHTDYSDHVQPDRSGINIQSDFCLASVTD